MTCMRAALRGGGGARAGASPAVRWWWLWRPPVFFWSSRTARQADPIIRRGSRRGRH
jgi:hypothetical protein